MKDSVLLKKLWEKYKDEQVYAVARENTLHIRDGADFPGESIVKKAAEGLRGKFVFRADAEYEPALQQIIPYVIVRQKDSGMFYVTERISGEERLKGSLALGAGGHINPVDMDDSGDLFENAAKRELFEELELKNAGKLRNTGFVRDFSSITADHLGVVYEIEAEDAAVKETDKLRGGWMTMEKLVERYGSFESWARLIIDRKFRTEKQGNQFPEEI